MYPIQILKGTERVSDFSKMCLNCRISKNNLTGVQNSLPLHNI